MSENKHIDHLLSKHGVLTSFSVARKVNEDSIKELTDYIKSISKNKVDFNNKLRHEISQKTQEAIVSGKIPGLIINTNNKPDIIHHAPEELTEKEGKPKKMKYNIDKLKLSMIYELVSYFNKIVLSNKFSKDDICFTIYTILNFLEIHADDFKRFQDKYSFEDDKELPDEDDEDEDDIDNGDSPK